MWWFYAACEHGEGVWWLSTWRHWDRWSNEEADVPGLMSHGASVTGHLIGSCQVLPLLSMTWMSDKQVPNIQQQSRVQTCDLWTTRPALTSQKPDSGILPPICCHGAALWGREERETLKLVTYVKSSTAPGNLPHRQRLETYQKLAAL